MLNFAGYVTSWLTTKRPTSLVVPGELFPNYHIKEESQREREKYYIYIKRSHRGRRKTELERERKRERSSEKSVRKRRPSLS